MQYQVKFLRRAGVRLPESAIKALPWVVVKILTPKKAGPKRLCLYPLVVNLQLHPEPKPTHELFKYSLQEISDDAEIYFGIEQRATVDGVAAVAQEWMLTRVSIGSRGWSDARERGITDDLNELDR